MLKLFHALDRRLDTGSFGSPWQRLKWALKYRLGSNRHVPDLVTLAERPHRPLLLETFDALGPWRSALEVGCGRGVNLLLLARRYPGATLIGMDISARAIESAQRELARYAVKARLSVGGAEDLSAYADNSADVVLADAVTMYLPPTSIYAALKEMCRVARLGVVVSTWHAVVASSSSPWIYDEGAWVYDYQRLLYDLPGFKSDILRYPADIWHDARWRAYGSIVRIYPAERNYGNG